jgi:hypothetical protein
MSPPWGSVAVERLIQGRYVRCQALHGVAVPCDEAFKPMFVLFGIGSCRGAVLTSRQRSGVPAWTSPGLGRHLSACGPPAAQGMVLHVGTRPPFPPELRREALAIVRSGRTVEGVSRVGPILRGQTIAAWRATSG